MVVLDEAWKKLEECPAQVSEIPQFSRVYSLTNDIASIGMVFELRV